MSLSVSSRPAMSANPTRQQLEELDELLNRMLKLPVRKESEAAEAVSTDEKPAAGCLDVESGLGQAVCDEPLETEPSVENADADTLPRYVADESPPIDQDESPAPALPVFRAPNPDDWVKLAATWQPSSQTWGPLAENWKQSSRAGGNALPMAEGPNAEPPLALPTASPTYEPIAKLPASLSMAFRARPVSADNPFTETEGTPAMPTLTTSDGTSWYLWPLIGFNVVFDSFLFLFGPLGEWLQGRKGRKVLGIVGACCLVIATGWLVMDPDGILRDLHIWLREWFRWTS